MALRVEDPLVAARGTAWQVVCAAVAASPSSSDQDRLVDACSRAPSWTAVLGLADWHRVTPQLHVALKRLPAGLVPAAALARLAEAFARTAARNLHLAAGCGPILRRLEDAGLSPITFKGPTLALTAYGSLAHRPFDDMDVIVAPETAGRAIDVLEAAGLTPSSPLSRQQAEAVVTAGRGLCCLDPARLIVIDLHGYLAPRYLPFHVPHRRLAEHTHQVQLLNERVRTLSPEMLLIALCVHGAKHSWTRLAWVCDIAALASVPGLVDWHTARALAAEHHAGRMLRLGLLLAERLLGTELPPAARPELDRDRTAVGLARRAATRFERPLAPRWSGLDAALFSLQAVEGARDRLRLCWRVIEPSVGDWETHRLPSYLRFMHYPLRVLRLIVRGIGMRRPSLPRAS